MTPEELFAKIQSGELPRAGILRRSGAAKGLVITTQHNGQTVEVPDIELEAGAE
jgi:hypothetical protein